METNTINMSLSKVTTEEVWWDEDNIDYVSEMLWKYSAPLIFILGCFGNITILVVLRWGRSSADTATTFFVQLVAAADLCVLVAGMFPEWMRLRHIADPMEDSAVGCKVYKFCMYSASDVAVWFMAAFTVERFISVIFPFERARVCRISRVKLCAVLLVVLAVVKNIHVFWTRGAEWELADSNHKSPVEDDILYWPFHKTVNMSNTGDNDTQPLTLVVTSLMITSHQNDNNYVLVSNCGYPTEEYKYFHLHARVWMVFVLANVVPLVILIVCNGAVIWTLVRRRKVQYDLGAPSAAESAALQVTIMCLVISISFIVFIMPTMILLVGKPHFKTSPSSTARYEIAKAVNNQLLYINHSINFYLYFITCHTFRHQTISLFLCRGIDRSGASVASRSAEARRISSAAAVPLKKPRHNTDTNSYSSTSTTLLSVKPTAV